MATGTRAVIAPMAAIATGLGTTLHRSSGDMASIIAASAIADTQTMDTTIATAMPTLERLGLTQGLEAHRHHLRPNLNHLQHPRLLQDLARPNALHKSNALRRHNAIGRSNQTAVSVASAILA